MDRIVAGALRHGTSVGWSRKQPAADSRGGEVVPKNTDNLSPRPLREIMDEGNPMMKGPVTNPTEQLQDDDDNILPALQ